MAQTLESFARKHDLYLEFRESREIITVLGRRNPNLGRKREVAKKVEWRVELITPVVMRSIFFESAGRHGRIWPAMGATRKEARNKFIAKIRGKTLIYYGVEMEEDTRVFMKVPKDLR